MHAWPLPPQGQEPKSGLLSDLSAPVAGACGQRPWHDRRNEGSGARPGGGVGRRAFQTEEQSQWEAQRWPVCGGRR